MPLRPTTTNLKIMKKIAWLGTLTSVLGSFIMALKIFLLGYIFFIVGSVSWLVVGIAKRDNALIALNGAFLLANLIGVYNV